MKKAAADVGLKWEDFTLTDNSCPAHPPQTPFPLSLFRKLQTVEAQFENEVEKDLKSFGRGFTVVESGVLSLVFLLLCLISIIEPVGMIVFVHMCRNPA